jgi:L-amino acid N-acyltransferase YncA
MDAMLRIRDATAADWPGIWPLFSEIVRARETYAYDPELSSEDARALWLESSERVVVAVGEDDAVLGSATMGANRPGPGAHVATASFMVGAAARGRGVGRALGEEVIRWATDRGFRSIQFNAVVETNAPAVGLWQSLGFEIVGTVPEAFEHPEHGYVGLHVMLKRLG